MEEVAANLIVVFTHQPDEPHQTLPLLLPVLRRTSKVYRLLEIAARYLKITQVTIGLPTGAIERDQADFREMGGGLKRVGIVLQGPSRGVHPDGLFPDPPCVLQCLPPRLGLAKVIGQLRQLAFPAGSVP